MFTGIRSILFGVLLIPALSAHAANVSGTVTNATSGDPISGARVIIGGFTGTWADTTTTSATGAYAFDSVPTGFRTVVASKDGYQPKTANVNVANANGNYTSNITLTPAAAPQTGTVAGTVKAAATNEAIKGATVILSHPAGRGGPTPIDTVVTDGEGRFSFAAVPVSNNYIVEATASGYSGDNNENVDVTNGATVQVPLVLTKLPTPNATVTGEVSDAESKGSLSATVVLRRRSTVGGVQTWTAVDTAVTNSGDGKFTFAGLEPSTLANPYSVVASKADYVSGTSANIVVANGATSTVDIALAKVAKGAMSIFVGLDSTGNPALAGAEVAATQDAQGGAVYTGTTDAKGWVTFASVVAGSYSVSANLAGFVSKATVRAVAANEKDTGYIYLARATTQNSKSLSGLVRDANGKAIAGAKVLFDGNGANGITLSATSTATGDYSFSGIPANVTGGTVTVTKDGYATFTGAVTLGSQAGFLNVTLKAAVGIVAAGRSFDRLLLVNDGSGLAAAFAASASTGTLSLYDARGSLRGAYSVPAGAVRASLRTSDLIGARFLVLRQGAATLRMAVPARF